MNREDALLLLVDNAPRNRLRAARSLQALAETGDYQVLRQSIEREPDAHVRRALVRVVHRIRPDQQVPLATRRDSADAPQQDLLEDVWAEATEHITGVFVHEMSPLVGAVTDAARTELAAAFGTSSTKAALGRLRDLVELLTQLHRASLAPETTEFNLTDLVIHGRADLNLGEDKRVRPARFDPVVIVGPSGAIRIAFANGLRNAMDAIDARPDPENGEVVINWGLTDQDAWISILDNGIGLPEGSHRVFDFGVTTKPKSEHFGFGLSISAQAMQSAGGTVDLTPRSNGGTSFVVRWPKDLAA